MSVVLAVLAVIVALVAPWLSPLPVWGALGIDATVLFFAAWGAALADL